MSLTDDLKNGVLPDGNYFCKTALGDIDVFNCVDGNLFTFADENQVYFVDEIIAICDYDHFVRLTEKVAKQSDELKQLRKDKTYLKWSVDVATYNYHASIAKNELLCELLKECSEYLGTFVIKSEIRDSLISKLCEVLK